MNLSWAVSIAMLEDSCVSDPDNCKDCCLSLPGFRYVYLLLNTLFSDFYFCHSCDKKVYLIHILILQRDTA